MDKIELIHIIEHLISNHKRKGSICGNTYYKLIKELSITYISLKVRRRRHYNKVASYLYIAIDIVNKFASNAWDIDKKEERGR